MARVTITIQLNASQTQQAINAINTGLQNIGATAGQIAVNVNTMGNSLNSSMTGAVVKANLLTDSFEKLVSISFKYVQTSTQMAARVEQLEAVNRQMAISNQLSAKVVEDQVASMQALGLTTLQSREVINRMIEGQIDLKNATKLAGVAFDIAAFSGKDFSEVLNNLTRGIVSGRTTLLRNLGLQVDLEAAYRRASFELGKNRKDLESYEKIQAATNEVLKNSYRLAGAFAAGITTSGEALQIFKNNIQETEIAVGKQFTPTLQAGTAFLGSFLKMVRDNAEAVAGLIKLVVAFGVAFAVFKTLTGIGAGLAALTTATFGWGAAIAGIIALLAALGTVVALSKNRLDLQREAVNTNIERLTKQKEALEHAGLSAKDYADAVKILTDRIEALSKKGEAIKKDQEEERLAKQVVDASKAAPVEVLRNPASAKGFGPFPTETRQPTNKSEFGLKPYSLFGLPLGVAGNFEKKPSVTFDEALATIRAQRGHAGVSNSEIIEAKDQFENTVSKGKTDEDTLAQLNLKQNLAAIHESQLKQAKAYLERIKAKDNEDPVQKARAEADAFANNLREQIPKATKKLTDTGLTPDLQDLVEQIRTHLVNIAQRQIKETFDKAVIEFKGAIDEETAKRQDIQQRRSEEEKRQLIAIKDIEFKTLDDRLSYASQVAQQERDMRLTQLDTVKAYTLRQELEVNAARAAVEVDYINKSTQLEVEKVKRRTEYEIQKYRELEAIQIESEARQTARENARFVARLKEEVEKRNVKGEFRYDPAEYQRELAEIENFNKQATKEIEKDKLESLEIVNKTTRAMATQGAVEETQIVENAEAQKRSILLKSVAEQMDITRKHYQQVFDTIKQSSSTLFDQLFSKSKGFFEGVANMFKTFFLTAIKEIVTSQIAARFTKLLTGEDVKFEGGPLDSTKAGGLGKLLSRVGLGTPVIGSSGGFGGSIQPRQTGGLATQVINLSGVGGGLASGGQITLQGLGGGLAGIPVSVGGGGGGNIILTPTVGGGGGGITLSPNIRGGGGGSLLQVLGLGGGGFSPNTYPGTPPFIPVGTSSAISDNANRVNAASIINVPTQSVTNPNGGFTNILAGLASAGVISLPQPEPKVPVFVGPKGAGIITGVNLDGTINYGGISGQGQAANKGGLLNNPSLFTDIFKGKFGGFGNSAVNSALGGIGLGVFLDGLRQGNGTRGTLERSIGAGAAAYGFAGKYLGVAGSIGVGLAADGLARGGKVGILEDAAGGALIGAQFGGPVGAAVGAAVGAIIGTIRLFTGTALDKLRKKIKDTYQIDISDRKILQQINDQIKQSYGGNIDVGIRAPQIRDLIFLYAQTVGQDVPLSAKARPSYLTDVGGVLSQNPNYENGRSYAFAGALPLLSPVSRLVEQSPSAGGTGITYLNLSLNGESASSAMRGETTQLINDDPGLVGNAVAQSTSQGTARRTIGANILYPGSITR